MERLNKPKKPFALLILSLLAFLGLGYVFFTISPSFSFSILGFSISFLFIFFPLLFLFLYGLAGFVFRNSLQGLLIGTFICCYFAFRLTGLTNPLFAILLIVLFLCLEALVWKRR